jgi:hypothetical protein
MALDEFLAEYRRRCVASVAALLRESGDVTLGELGDLLAAVPELRRMTLAELFERPPPPRARPASAPLSAAAKVAGYLMDQATSAGLREARGLRVEVPSYAQLGERLGVPHDSVALTMAILKRRRVITVASRRVVVRDLRGLAVLAGRPTTRMPSAPYDGRSSATSE